MCCIKTWKSCDFKYCNSSPFFPPKYAQGFDASREGNLNDVTLLINIFFSFSSNTHGAFRSKAFIRVWSFLVRAGSMFVNHKSSLIFKFSKSSLTDLVSFNPRRSFIILEQTFFSMCMPSTRFRINKSFQYGN